MQSHRVDTTMVAKLIGGGLAFVTTFFFGWQLLATAGALLVSGGIAFMTARFLPTELLFESGKRLFLNEAAVRSEARVMPVVESVEEAQMTLRRAGLEKSQLLLGIDFTKSNTFTGNKTFGGRSLHALIDGNENPYQLVLRSVMATLAAFDDDKTIPMFAFGDSTTRNRSVKQLGTAESIDQALALYADAVRQLKLDGPTSFVPLIREAMACVERTETEFHVLVIITDGAIDDEDETRALIVEAAQRVPLSILVVGVGDGPWDTMETFDSDLPERAWDNFAFVNYTQLLTEVDANEVAFAYAALRELPDHYRACKKLRLLGRRPTAAGQRKPRRND